MPRYHFEIRTAASRSLPGQTFTPAYYAETLEQAEAEAQRSYPSAVRVILVDIDRGYRDPGRYRGVVRDPAAWRRVALEGRRFA